MARTRGAGAALALASYVVAFALLTWPLVTRPFGAVVSHWDADIEHSLWLQWWFATALESPEHALFRTDMIAFPFEVDLRLADLNLAVNGLHYLLGQLLPLAGAYNAALLLSFLLAGLAMRRLLLRLHAGAGAAWLGGLCFAGSPYWLACALNGWCYLVHTWVLPGVLLALLRARDAPGPAGGALAGLALALGFHVTPYYLLYTAVLLGVLLPWWAGACRGWLRQPGAPAGLAAGAAAFLLTVGPRALGMLAASGAELVAHHGPLNTALAAPLAELVWPAPAAVEARAPRLGYLVVFLGWTQLATIAAGLALGSWRVLAPWLVSAAVLLLLSLGPALVLADGARPTVALPAAWLQRLPVFELTTNHWRWTLPAGFCLVIAFALALTRLAAAAGRRRAGGRRALSAALLVLLALEAAFVWPIPRETPLWEPRTAPVARLLGERDDVHALLDRSDRRKLNQTVHRKPIALGWLPRLDAEVRRANEAMVRVCAGEPPACLRRYGIDAVLRRDGTALLLRADGSTQVLEPR